jgi:hypothetical protein
MVGNHFDNIAVLSVVGQHHVTTGSGNVLFRFICVRSIFRHCNQKERDNTFLLIRPQQRIALDH